MSATPPDLLGSIPDRLLLRAEGRAAFRQGRDLERWTLEHGFRPSLLEIEHERRRRTDTRP